MAIPASGFSLNDVRIELGLGTTASLLDCISNVGRTGLWNKLSDFANYSSGEAFQITEASMVFDGSGTPSQTLTITSSGAWTLILGESWMNITGSLTGTGDDTRLIYCDSLGAGARGGTIDGKLDTNPLVSDSCSISQVF